MKMAMGVRRRDAGTPLTPGGSKQNHVDDDTCVLTTRTLQGAVLDLAVVPSDSKLRFLVSALENAVLPDDRVGVPWAVVDNASLALHAALSWSFPPLRGVALDTCHLPKKYEAMASHHGSAGSRMLRRLVSKFNMSFPSEVCPDVDAHETFRGERNLQFTRDEVFFYDQLCRASLHREHMDAAVTSMKSAKVWAGVAEWIRALAAVATLFSRRWRCTQSSEVFPGRRTTCRCPHSASSLTSSSFPSRCLSTAADVPRCSARRVKVQSFKGTIEVIPVSKCHRRSHYVSVPIPPYPRSSLGVGPGAPSV